MQEKSFDISNKSVFSEGYQEFVQSRMASRLQDKFRDKPFFERWIRINQQVNITSFILNAFSIFTGFTFLFFGLLFLMGISTTFNEIQGSSYIFLALLSGILSIALLVLSESLKRGVAKHVFQAWLQYKKFSFAILGMMLFSGMSIFFSYQGADRFVYEVREAPILVDVDSIQNHFTLEIAATDVLLEENFKKNSWKGKFSRDSRPTYNTLHAEKARLAQERDKQLEQANIQNTAILNAHNQKTEHLVSTFALVQIVVELALLLCLFWMEYYDFRSAAEFAKTPHKTVYPVSETLVEQEKQAPQPKRTIEHNGKHYTEGQVNNFIRISEKRASNPRSDEDTRSNNQQTLDYGFSRKMEFAGVRSDGVGICLAFQKKWILENFFKVL